MHAIVPRQSAAFRPAAAYEALSNTTRRRLLDYLRTSGPCVTLVLADEFELSNLKVRHHLDVLKAAGLVRLRPANAGDQIATFSPIGWARLKRQWENGMQHRVGGLRIVR